VKLPCMAEPKLRRRGHGEDAIYFAASKNRYVGAVSLGFTPEGKRIRRKVSGKTKQEVRDTLRALHKELDAGVSHRRGVRFGGPWRTGSAKGCMADPRRPRRSMLLPSVRR
jgi:hypothetical protein